MKKEKNEKLYDEYIDLSYKIKVMQDRQKILKGIIEKQFESDGTEKVESEKGLITICERKTWVYSNGINIFKESLKNAQEKEQENGTAKENITKFIKTTLR